MVNQQIINNENKNVSDNIKKLQIEKLANIINVDEINAFLNKNNDDLKNYIIRNEPEHIIYLLSILKEVLKDPRRQYGHILHQYTPIMLIIFLGVLCGYDNVKSIHVFGRDLWPTVMSILDLNENYPDYNTFRRVLIATSPDQLTEARERWHELIGISRSENLNTLLGNDSNNLLKYNEQWQDKMKEDLEKLKNDQYQPPVTVAAQDGKVIKATRSAVNQETGRDIISIYDVQTKIVLAESTVPEKTNEITENKEVIKMLNPNDTYLLSYDAMGCQHELADAIEGYNWYYLFKVKNNQMNLRKCIKVSFDQFKTTHVVTRESTDGGHYTRWDFYVCENTSLVNKNWQSVRCLGKVITYSERDGQTTIEDSYFIMNFLDPVLFVFAKVKHWHIENRLHHPLDCVFDEDRCRVRSGHGHENLNILRKSAISFYRRAISYIKENWVSLRTLAEILRKSIYTLNLCIKKVRNGIKFSASDLFREIIIL